MQSHHFLVQKTAHYYSIGEAGSHIRHWIIALHGYGQAGSNFVQKFNDLDDGRTLVVCPEGLNRFYWKGLTGKVAASWMTKKDRTYDIRDNMRYLDQLYQHFRPQLADDVQITVLGFSQGCPTASRWVAAQTATVHHLVLWAGQLAHDEDYSLAQEYLNQLSLYFVYGEEDEYIEYGMVKRQNQLAQAAGLHFQTLTFPGRHTIHRPTLRMLMQRISSI